MGLIMSKVRMWTDGSCHQTTKMGGTATILSHEKGVLVMGAPLEDTTNNRAETQAFLDGVDALKRSCHIELLSDSRYLINGIARIFNGKGIYELNADLWAEVEHALLSGGHTVNATHVYGHSDDRVNNLCDAIAGYCAKKRITVYEKYASVLHAIDLIQSLKKGK